MRGFAALRAVVFVYAGFGVGRIAFWAPFGRVLSPIWCVSLGVFGVCAANAMSVVPIWVSLVVCGGFPGFVGFGCYPVVLSFHRAFYLVCVIYLMLFLFLSCCISCIPCYIVIGCRVWIDTCVLLSILTILWRICDMGKYYNMGDVATVLKLWSEAMSRGEKLEFAEGTLAGVWPGRVTCYGVDRGAIGEGGERSLVWVESLTEFEKPVMRKATCWDWIKWASSAESHGWVVRPASNSYGRLPQYFDYTAGDVDKFQRARVTEREEDLVWEYFLVEDRD